MDLMQSKLFPGQQWSFHENTIFHYKKYFHFKCRIWIIEKANFCGSNICLYWPTALWWPSAKMHTHNYLNITMFRTLLNKMKMQTMMKKLIILQLRFMFEKFIIIAIILHSKIKTYSFNCKPNFYKVLLDEQNDSY